MPTLANLKNRCLDFVQVDVYPVVAAKQQNVAMNLGRYWQANSTHNDLQPGRWQFAVSAMKDGIESDLGQPLLVESPARPGGLRTVAIQFSMVLTNWNDIGFFKLSIP